jgi:hypothetical protein
VIIQELFSNTLFNSQIFWIFLDILFLSFLDLIPLQYEKIFNKILIFWISVILIWWPEWGRPYSVFSAQEKCVLSAGGAGTVNVYWATFLARVFHIFCIPAHFLCLLVLLITEEAVKISERERIALLLFPLIFVLYSLALSHYTQIQWLTAKLALKSVRKLFLRFWLTFLIYFDIKMATHQLFVLLIFVTYFMSFLLLIICVFILKRWCS